MLKKTIHNAFDTSSLDSFPLSFSISTGLTDRQSCDVVLYHTVFYFADNLATLSFIIYYFYSPSCLDRQSCLHSPCIIYYFTDNLVILSLDYILFLQTILWHCPCIIFYFYRQSFDTSLYYLLFL